MHDFARPTYILSTTLREHHVQNFNTLKLEIKIFEKNIHYYNDSFLTKKCNLDPIAEDMCDNIQAHIFFNKIYVSCAIRMYVSCKIL